MIVGRGISFAILKNDGENQFGAIDFFSTRELDSSGKVEINLTERSRFCRIYSTTVIASALKIKRNPRGRQSFVHFISPGPGRISA
jgi:hypothetical protein